MSNTGNKVYLNRRRLYEDIDGPISYNGLTWSSNLTEPNTNMYGQPVYSGVGPYFPPILDLSACPIVTTSTTTTTTTLPFENFRISSTTITAFTISVDRVAGTYSTFIDWGDGATSSEFSSNTPLTHTYSSPYSGFITIKSVDLSTIRGLYSDSRVGTNVVVNGTEFGPMDGMTKLELVSTRLTSTSTQLPRSLTRLYTLTNNLSGNVSGLPTGLTGQSVIQGSNTLTGNISGLPRGLSNLSLLGSNTLSGDVSGLPPNMTAVDIRGFNTINGDVSGIPSTITSLLIEPSALSGDISGFPNGIVTITLRTGNPTISGDISGIPPNLSSCTIYGSNTINGDIGGISTTVLSNLSINGYNTISGSVSGIPHSITSIAIQGSNTITGDISGLTSSNITTMSITGNNTISGNVSGIPSSIAAISIQGFNTITGDIYYLPPNLTSINIQGFNSIDSYTPGKTWSYTGVTMSNLTISTIATGFDSTEIDNILIDIYNTAPIWNSPRTLNLTGVSLPKRTSASDAAILGLTSSGITVTLN